MKLTNTTDRRMSATNRKGMPIIIAPGESEDVDIEDEDYTVKEFNISPKVFRRHQTLNFSHTGVFEWHGCKPGLFIVNMSEVCGKVVMIQNLLMTVPMNVLTEV